eukprot:NODE_639_length_5670_cov_0.131754.p3 type:complete len:242 gc:universal NODE_639_length_5670_cov_0.131754:3678-2953(-)
MQDLQNLLNKKLYHQLTELIISRLSDDKFQAQLPAVYATYLKPIEQHVHPLKLAKLATMTAQLKTVPEALVFLNELVVKFTPTEDDYKKWTCLKIQAFIFLKLQVVHYNCVIQDYATADTLLKQAEIEMSKVTSLEVVVNAQYYKVKSDWYQLKGEFELYYTTSFEYLKYASNLPNEESKRRGMDMSIAALLGNIYRFGDLIQHPVFKQVDEWLHQLIVAAQQGQLTVFEQLKPQIQQSVS